MDHNLDELHALILSPSASPHTAMTEMITLWCNLKGDSSLFSVEIAPEQTVAFLKEFIWEKRKNGMFRGIDAADLVLWKAVLRLTVQLPID
jgi:hypothetical protein